MAAIQRSTAALYSNLSLSSSALSIILKHVLQGPEQESRQEHGDGKREHPGQRKIADRAPLQPGMIGGHGAGDTRRKHVSGTDRQTQVVGPADGQHGGDFS